MKKPIQEEHFANVADFTSGKTIHGVFSNIASRFPDRPAVIFGQSMATFKQIDELSDAIAERLSSEGVYGRVVGLFMNRSIDYAVALVGVLKSGGVAMPLPTDYPDQRLSDVLKVARPALVIADEGVLGRVPSFVSSIGFTKCAEPPTNRRIVPMPTDSKSIALVLCSSGSTGVPKLIKRSHESLWPRMEWAWSNLPYQSEEVACQKSYMTTSHSLYELLEPILVGNPVVVIPDEETKDLEKFWKIIGEKKIERLLLVPSMLRTSLDAERVKLPPLKVVVLMGESVSLKFAKDLVKRFDEHTEIYSVYGTTEGGSFLATDLRSAVSKDKMPMGTPLTKKIGVHVLGDDGKEVLAGESGVLHISGLSVDGYLDESQTSDNQKISPQSQGSGLYNTLDLVKRLESGELEYIGRTDHMIKIRGFRVDLEEVERKVLSHEMVKNAAAVSCLDFAGNTYIAVFVSPDTIDISALKTFLKSELPDYMVPSPIVSRAELPLTPGGKLDRMKLKKSLELGADALVSSSVSNVTERKILQLWHRLFPGVELSPASNFFELGGSSLNVFQAVEMLRRDFELKSESISAATIYAHPTATALAKSIDRAKSGQPDIAVDPTEVVLVTLKQSLEKGLSPLFLVSPSGGTVAPYKALVEKLVTDREIIGLRDPFLLGAREGTQGFQDWIEIYIRAIKKRQSSGPYFIGGFSSASSLAYEIAHQLKIQKCEVGGVYLIDPIQMGFALPGSRGRDSSIATMSGSHYWKWSFFFSDFMRSFKSLWKVSGQDPLVNDRRLSVDELTIAIKNAKSTPRFIWNFGLTAELDTGAKIWPEQMKVDDYKAEELWTILMEKLRAAFPETDASYFERVFVQYFCLQGGGVHSYYIPPGKLDSITIFEVRRRSTGALKRFFKPYAQHMDYYCFQLGEHSSAMKIAARAIGPQVKMKYVSHLDFSMHMGSIRDEKFANAVASQLSQLLSRSRE